MDFQTEMIFELAFANEKGIEVLRREDYHRVLDLQLLHPG